MTGPPNKKRPPGGGRSNDCADQSESQHHRTAIDGPELVAEAIRLIDATDIIIISALAGGEFTISDACEHALTMHGKARQLLNQAFVGVAA